MTTIQEYQAFTPTTIAPNSSIKSDEGRFAYRVLGMLGEFAEFVEKVCSGAERGEIIKEAGDFLWYLSETCNEMGWSLATMLNVEPKAVTALDAIGLMGGVSEAAKKFSRDYSPATRDRLEAKLALKIGELSALFQTLLFAADDNSSLGEVMEINMVKLTDRKDRNVLQGSGDNR